MRSPETAEVHEVHDPASGLHAWIVLDSLARGPAFGGVRRQVYSDAAAGLADARRLARAMSLKCALAELPAGGGKTVILDHPGLDRPRAYEALGAAIAALDGRYVCGPDIGTGAAELEALRRRCTWVNPARNDAGRSTAQGVLAGLRGLSEVVFGDRDLGRRRYVIQGLGSVGGALARALRGAGAEVSAWDPRPSARAEARSLGVRELSAETIMLEPCDVFMPCALGQTLDLGACRRGSWEAVCGSANNQLVDGAAAEVLRARKIAWAPDFVVNAGAVIEGVLSVGVEPQGPPELTALEAEVEAAIQKIEARCARILRVSLDAEASPFEVAIADGQARLKVSDGPGQSG